MSGAGDHDGVPVVTVDGPNAAGKGTISQLLARGLGWHLLDSGALYRLVALAAQDAQVGIGDVDRLAGLARAIEPRFIPGESGEPASVSLAGQDVTAALRTEACADAASRIAGIPAVRLALLATQRRFRAPPGLVADGRDMGTVVFPDAALKIFLTASAEERARRRHKQLRQKGIDVNLAALSVEIAERDRRDRERATSPLKPAPDAVRIETSGVAIEAVLDRVLGLVHARGLTNRQG